MNSANGQHIMANTRKIPMRSPTARHNPLPLVFGLALLIAGAMVYSLPTGSRLAEHCPPLVDAATEIELDAALGHLWFEEVVGDGRAKRATDARAVSRVSCALDAGRPVRTTSFRQDA